MKAGLLHTVLIAACFLSACGGDDTAPATTVCTPGDTKACVGPGACAGGQVCSADGRSYGACDCGGAKVDGSTSPAIDASAGGSGGASGSGGAAGAAGSAGTGGTSGGAGSVVADASTDSKATDGAAAFCTPQGDGGFTNTYVPAHAGHQGVCTSQQISDYWTSCFGEGAGTAACNAFKGASAGNTACASCILPTSTTSLGALVYIVPNLAIDINYAGCMEIAGGAPGSACAKDFQASALCQVAACVGDCPLILDGGSNLGAFGSCRTAASDTVCSALEMKSETCLDALADGGVTVCFQGQSVVDLYKSVAGVFCGN
jgi:hypothetical protein